jgi:protein-ribulosamine 3-kinase
MTLKEISVFIQSELTPVLGRSISSLAVQPIGGGSINQTFRIAVDQNEHFFCKINSAPRFPALFEKEKNGLELLAAQQLIRIPAVIACAAHNDHQILILERIEQGLRTDRSWKNFGEQLARLHSQSWVKDGQVLFGLYEDNYMGALAQSNSPTGNWVDFFIHQRLRPQVKLAFDRGLLNTSHLQQFDRLYKALPNLFQPVASCLLHGDLWSGNFLIDTAEQPVLIDPAVYYGHAAMDLAMTTLFGGFDKAFYEAYHYHSPFDNNYRQQWEVCNLYPLLIHLNLFGSSYRYEIESGLEGF